MNSQSLQNTVGFNYYFTQADTDKIDAFIDALPDDTTINVIGHSWGGDTAAQVVLNNPDAINTLVTADPVSWFHPNYSNLAASVNTWINVNPNSTSQPNPTGGDIAATIGRAWGSGPDNYATIPIDTQLHHENFNGMMNTQAKSGQTPSQILNTGY